MKLHASLLFLNFLYLNKVKHWFDMCVFNTHGFFLGGGGVMHLCYILASSLYIMHDVQLHICIHRMRYADVAAK